MISFWLVYIFLLILGGALYTIQPKIFENNIFWTLIVTFVFLILPYYILHKKRKIFDWLENLFRKDIQKPIDKKIKFLSMQGSDVLLKNYEEIILHDSKQEKIELVSNLIWREIPEAFSSEHKTEVYNLAKKYNMIDTFYIEFKKNRLFRILYLSHILELLYSFKDALINIESKDFSGKNNKSTTEGKETDKEKEKKLLDDLIFLIRLYKYTTGLKLCAKFLLYLTLYFLPLILFVCGLAFSIDYFLPYIKFDFLNTFLSTVNSYIKFQDMGYFFLGLWLVLIALPFTYFVYSLIRIQLLKIEKIKHDAWENFFKKVMRYLFHFMIFLALILIGAYSLLHSGMEYQKFFSFFAKLLFPTLSFDDIKPLYEFLFTPDTGHLIEDKAVLLKKEFLSVVIIFKVIFITFISFIGYSLIRHLSEIYLEFYDNHKERRLLLPPEFIKIFSYLILFIVTTILLYGTLFINYPELLQQIAHGGDGTTTKNGLVASDHSNSFRDYLPLSIFLALFGAIVTMATKDLLENYFAGLSLKINSPYETGERITIDDMEMMEVIGSGFRADKFYGISTNTEITIPHKKLIYANIVNYTQPTLDYRQKITVYVPDMPSARSIPREAEKVLLLAAFINTGVKKPEFLSGLLEENRLLCGLKKYKGKVQTLIVPKEAGATEKTFIKNSHKVWELCEAGVTQCVESIWKEFKESSSAFKRALFLEKIESIIDDSELDEDKKKINLAIKKIIASILTTVLEYEEKERNFYWHLDNYCIRRKYQTFTKNRNIPDIPEKDIIDFKNTAELLVNISYYYFALAKQIWRLKENIQPSLKKAQIDSVSLALLNVPRVTSAHKRDESGTYWEVSLLITAELGEQSDEITHHINMYIDELLELFGLSVPYQQRMLRREMDKMAI